MNGAIGLNAIDLAVFAAYLVATVVLTVVGFGFSAYLTYRELFTIDAICQWCVASAVVMTAIAVLAAVRVWRAPGPARTYRAEGM